MSIGRLSRLCGLLLALAVAGCGGGATLGDGDGGGNDGGDTPTPVEIAKLELLADATSIPGDADTIAEGVTLTAQVINSDGNLVADVTVAFAVTTGNGVLQVTRATTDESGSATAILTTGGDSSARTITVSASTTGGGGTFTDSLSLPVISRVASITLLSSSASLPSSADTADEGLTITALVRDGNNQLVEGVPVSFSADLGALQVTEGTTDASGAATAVLTTGGNPRNQDITITASAQGISRSIAIPVTGTTLTITGADVVGSGDVEVYTITLLDAANAPIPNQAVTVTSLDLGNAISFVDGATTDTQGVVQVEYTGSVGGEDRLEASSVGVTTQKLIDVSAFKLVFETPQSSAEVLFSDSFDTEVRVRLTQNGQGVANAGITFAITRGLINATTPVPCTDVNCTTTTGADGRATVNVRANGAGNAGGTVIAATATTSGVSASLPIEFVATTPSTVTLQTNPAVIPINGTSEIRAVVRDADDNLVKNKRVNFTLSDTTGGSLSAAFGITNSLGVVSIVYQATATSSATDGVAVTGVVDGTSSAVDTATLTVGGEALRILLGTGNELEEPTTTTYSMPWVAIVTDSAGNPPPEDTVFRISLEPVAYQKGVYVAGTDQWVAAYSVSGSEVQTEQSGAPSSPLDNDAPPFGCLNEDADRDGILNPGEDFNGNATLDPGGVAVVGGAPTLDENGTSFFSITYPQGHANWVQMRLRAQATVAGTETTAFVDFVLPVAASDVNDLNVAPPGILRDVGVVSPYGFASTCSDPN